MPTAIASSTTDLSTCRRDAPRVRRVASSRTRCATVIESVFAITELPTTRAIPPKASRNIRKESTPFFVSLLSEDACAVAVLTCAVAGRSGAISRTSRAGATPLAPPILWAESVRRSAPSTVMSQAMRPTA